MMSIKPFLPLFSLRVDAPHMSCWCLAHVVLLVNTNGADGRNLSKYC